MRIQHNISALNAHRQLGGNNNMVSKNLEKLSSGYRINRAGDDAAGLAISEKMRAQIKGLDTAQKNAQDGISLVQTAEGALTEVHSMLNRMVELATQSANGTYDNETDRANLQKEVESLKTEINRISESTNYNGIKLLDGSLGGNSVAGGLTGASISTFKPSETAATAANDIAANVPAKAATYEIDFAGLAIAATETVVHNGVTVTEGTTPGLDATNTVAENTQAIADAWSQDAAFANYDVTVDGTKIKLTAKNTGVDPNATNMSKAITGTGISSMTNKNVTATAGAAAVINTDYFAKDTLNIDGVDVKVDWSKLSEDDRNILSKDWTKTDSSVKASDAEAAAKLIQNTINDSIKAHNNANGTDLKEIKVEAGGADNAAKTFKFISGSKDGSSKISFTGVAANKTVLGNLLGAGTINSNPVDPKLNFTPTDANGKFTMNVGDQSIEVNLKGLTAKSTAKNLVSKLETAINDALANYDTAQGLTGNDATSGKIKVSVNSDGALEFTNTTGEKISFEDKGDGEVAKILGISKEGKAASTGGLTLQVGDTSDDYQKVTVSIGNMDSESLDIANVNINKQENAQAAIDQIKKAINTVSATRGDLGAIQNRLDHTINNLSVTSENMTAAESRIRDVDMAKEMMDFTKNNILTQASQAMLAQANQLPQGVLQLLQ